MTSLKWPKDVDLQFYIYGDVDNNQHHDKMRSIVSRST